MDNSGFLAVVLWLAIVTAALFLLYFRIHLDEKDQLDKERARLEHNHAVNQTLSRMSRRIRRLENKIIERSREIQYEYVPETHED